MVDNVLWRAGDSGEIHILNNIEAKMKSSTMASAEWMGQEGC